MSYSFRNSQQMSFGFMRGRRWFLESIVFLNVTRGLSLGIGLVSSLNSGFQLGPRAGSIVGLGLGVGFVQPSLGLGQDLCIGVKAYDF